MTLTDAAAKTKGFLKWGAIFFAAIFLLFLIFQAYSALFPAPAPKPEVAFGKLPSPDFPESAKGNPEYFIDTISGALPSFSDQVRVYKMEERPADILGLSKAKSLVSNVGFTNEPVKISDNIYQWKTNGKTLTLNINDLNFNMISDFLANSNRPNFPKDEETAKETAQTFLQSMGLLPPDLNFEKTSADLYLVKNFSIVPATSLSNSQAVQVSFFQNDIDNLPIFYARHSVSTMNFLVGSVGTDIEVVDANFFYQKPSEISSTYPIKSAQEALEDLKRGNAYIVKATSDRVGIKNVTLGYFISERKQEYLLPIIVFESEDGFVAYVNAIAKEWVDK